MDMRRHLRYIMLGLTVNGCLLNGQTALKHITISVLNFEYETNSDPELAWVRSGIPEYLHYPLQKSPLLRLVERNRVKSIIDEMGLGQSGMINENEAVQAGRLVGAQFNIIGSVLKTNLKKVLIIAKIVDTKTSEVIATEKIDGLQSNIVPSLLDSLAAKLIRRITEYRPVPDVNANPEDSGLSAQTLNTMTEAGMYFTASSLSSTAHFHNAQNLLDRGDWRKAVEEYQKAIDLDTTFARAYVNLGVVLLQHDQLQSSKTILRKAVEIAPHLGLGHYNLGLCFGQEGNYIDAVNHFQKALSIERDNSEISVELGKAYYKMGQYPQALEVFNNVLHVDSLFVSANYYRGILYKRTNHTDSALIDWGKVLFSDEPYFREVKQQAYKQLGDHFFPLHQYNDCILNYSHALQLDIKHQDPQTKGKILLGLGKSLLQIDSTKQAAERFEQAIPLIPNDPELHLYYGVSLMGLEKIDRAIAALKAASKLDVEGPFGKQANVFLDQIEKH